MKQKVLYLALLLLVVIACGGDTQAGQVGIKLSTPITSHGHSGPTDGGTINARSFNVINVSVDQVVASGAYNDLVFVAEVSDEHNEFDMVTNRHTPQVEGVYLYTLQVCGKGVTTLTHIRAAIKINTTIYTHNTSKSFAAFTAGQYSCVERSALIRMNGTTDYISGAAMIIGSGTLSIQGVLHGILIAR